MSSAPKFCVNTACPLHQKLGGQFNKKGHYKIRRLNQWIRRYQCKLCKVTFSSRTLKPNYKHKKMDLNRKLQLLLTEGNSLRACSRLLGMTYKNTYNKFVWLSQLATVKRSKLKLAAQTLYFDEMETIHHTKCKPLSIAIAVNENYQVLGLEVAQMPAKGRLATISRIKYGARPDEREGALQCLFEKMNQALVRSPSLVISDQKPSYKKHVLSKFPGARYETYCRSDKERLQTRLHEKLQKRRFDPMFVINQRCAKLRSNIRRLTRRSWCTTKKVENLQGHLDLFVVSQFGRIC